jgi:hypothetical protein
MNLVTMVNLRFIFDVRNSDLLDGSDFTCSVFDSFENSSKRSFSDIVFLKLVVLINIVFFMRDKVLFISIQIQGRTRFHLEISLEGSYYPASSFSLSQHHHHLSRKGQHQCTLFDNLSPFLTIIQLL